MKEEFKTGEVVRHKASGQLGVVVGYQKRCITHSQVEHFFLNVARMNGKKIAKEDECELENTGNIELELGFHEDNIVVESIMIERYPAK